MLPTQGQWLGRGQWLERGSVKYEPLAWTGLYLSIRVSRVHQAFGFQSFPAVKSGGGVRTSGRLRFVCEFCRNSL